MKYPMLTLILNDEAITNDRGWKLLNSGLDRSRYDKNPILLHQHDLDQIVGHCTSLYIEGSKLMGTFEFDSDEASQAIEEKATKGSLRGVSPGLYIRQMSTSEEGDVVSDWELLEVSLVTLPSNPNAVSVKLYSQKGEALSEAEAAQHIVQLKAQTNNALAQRTTTGEKLKLREILGLAKDASLEDCLQAVQRVITEREALSADLETIRTRDAQRLLGEALEAKKITPEMKEDYMTLYAFDSELCRRILLSIPSPTAPTPPQSLASRLAKAQSNQVDQYAADWDTLDRQGLLSQLKAEDPDRFEEKFKERFN